MAKFARTLEPQSYRTMFVHAHVLLATQEQIAKPVYPVLMEQMVKSVQMEVAHLEPLETVNATVTMALVVQTAGPTLLLAQMLMEGLAKTKEL